ncbi:MAG TPA: carboxypeptidase-like regulatory domain-containing protein, partial [Bryobacteraceae bacterium]|nr:carboxypeptidase-like regulatory domain-containing protein [Bryobacteraceae bacterium]
FAEQPLQVAGSDVRGIVLSPCIVEAVDLPGSVTFEGGARPRPITVGLHGANGMPQSARSNDDGSFVLKGLVPDHYALQWAGEWSQQTAAASPLVLSSARLGDREFSQWEGFDFDGSAAGPLRITFSAGVTVKGEILDAGGLPAPNVPVSFISATGSGSFAAMSNSDGTFTSSPLLPGDYRVYVLPDYAHMDLAQDPDYLKAHENDFPPLHVAAGVNPPLTLRVPATQQ